MSGFQIRKMTVTAILAAVSTVLMFLSFNVPFMPSFIKMDFSELPALIAAFAYGPLSGVIVCLIKNLINLLSTQTGGVGELSNFILGCAFVLPAGLIYKHKKTKKKCCSRRTSRSRNNGSIQYGFKLLYCLSDLYQVYADGRYNCCIQFYFAFD